MCVYLVAALQGSLTRKILSQHLDLSSLPTHNLIFYLLDMDVMSKRFSKGKKGEKESSKARVSANLQA